MSRGLWLLTQTKTQPSSSCFHSPNPSFRLRILPHFFSTNGTLLCRLWFGVSIRNAHSFDIGMPDTPICHLCNFEERTELLFFLCDRYNIERDVPRTALVRVDCRPYSETKVLRQRPNAPKAYKITRTLLFLKIICRQSPLVYAWGTAPRVCATNILSLFFLCFQPLNLFYHRRRHNWTRVCSSSSPFRLFGFLLLSLRSCNDELVDHL